MEKKERQKKERLNEKRRERKKGNKVLRLRNRDKGRVS